MTRTTEAKESLSNHTSETGWDCQKVMCVCVFNCSFPMWSKVLQCAGRNYWPPHMVQNGPSNCSCSCVWACGRSVMSFNSLLIYIYVFPIVNMRIAHVKCAYQISWRRPLTQNVQITRWTATGCMVPLKWVDLFVWSADCGMREIFDEVEHDFDSSI